MLREWVRYLCDPIDKTSLKIDEVIEKKGHDILFGTLKSRSGNRYSIKEGIPILLNRRTQPIRTVDSFAYEWENFDFDYGKKGWLQDVVRPTLGSAKYFKNKVILDCGAGSGRQSLWMAQAGAKFIFSIELSDSARTMVKKVTSRFKDRVFVIQADIAHLPINRKAAVFDLVYCINVVQHTENAKKTTAEISKLLGRNTDFIFNIYLRRGKSSLINFVQLFRKLISDLPNSLIKFISFIIAILIYPLKLRGNSFKELWLDVYDLLGTHHYQRFYSERYLAEILRELNLEIIKRTYYAMLLRKTNASI